MASPSAKASGPDQPVQATRSAPGSGAGPRSAPRALPAAFPRDGRRARVIKPTPATSTATTGGIAAVDDATGSPGDTPDSEAPGNDGQTLRRLK